MQWLDLATSMVYPVYPRSSTLGSTYNGRFRYQHSKHKLWEDEDKADRRTVVISEWAIMTLTGFQGRSSRQNNSATRMIKSSVRMTGRGMSDSRVYMSMAIALLQVLQKKSVFGA